MKNEEIDHKKKLETDLKKIIQLSKLLLDSDYKNYDASEIFDIIRATASSAEAT